MSKLFLLSSEKESTLKGKRADSFFILTPFQKGTIPANMYIWDPYGQNLGIYPIWVLHGPHIGFFTHIRPI